MKINCDIGERGAGHPVDRELMRHIDIANIACGGHAGDDESIAAFRALAKKHSIEISAHLSYPDRENFGRLSLELDEGTLTAALDQQLARMPDVKTVKFHGALYNDSVTNPALAKQLVRWLKQNRIERLTAPADSEIARQATGIQVLAEAFADRRYCLSKNGSLELVSRAHPDAIFQTLEEALEQCQRFEQGKVTTFDGAEHTIRADTLCVHSDSDISLSLIQALPPFRYIRRGLSAFVMPPAFGQQSLGVSPGGPQDRFSFETGHILLGNSVRRSLEFILPPVLEVTRAANFVLTGARFKKSPPHAIVFSARPGDQLRFGRVEHGLRGYLAWGAPDEALAARTLPPFEELANWQSQRIRILPGPELDWAEQPERLISNPWKIGTQSNEMGLQLKAVGHPLRVRSENMISAPVTDGTVQLTPGGPIVLMRQRQTVGGYPRVAQVIEADLDRLAQIRPDQVIRFEWTDLKTARELLLKKQSALRELTDLFPNTGK
jgi:UPF0271 protein